MKIFTGFKSAIKLPITLLSLLLVGCGGGQPSSSGEPALQSPIGKENKLPSKVQEPALPPLSLTANQGGVAATFTNAGAVDQTNPFFKSFGNGRSCASCHQEKDGWSITPASILERFNQTDGKDPLFLLLDAANSPQADVSTNEARRAAYSMLLSKGLIRIGLPMPTSAEFTLTEVEDPYGYASPQELSLFRRPLPTTNLKFSPAVMWDGRETHKDATSNTCIKGTQNCFKPLSFNLGKQANSAILTHAQAAAALTQEEQDAIVGFQSQLFTAQVFDNSAKSLTAVGAKGGPFALSKNEFYFGINDLEAGDYRTGANFTQRAMNLYDSWINPPADPDIPSADAEKVAAARKSIARGQGLFNNRPIILNNVGGLKNASVRGTCTTCHNTPNAGSHPIPLLFNLGLSDASQRTSDLPLYTLRNKQSGETIQTTDPGAALHTGKWEDIGRFKVPVLRGLAARAPYFHNGSAKDLKEVVEFYNDRFKIGLSAEDITDIAAFLNSL